MTCANVAPPGEVMLRCEVSDEGAAAVCDVQDPSSSHVLDGLGEVFSEG